MILRFLPLIVAGLIVCPSITSADILHLKDGKRVLGEITKDTATKITIKGLNGKKKAYAKSKIDRVEITWGQPDLARTDPKWSGLMVNARIKRDLQHVQDKLTVSRTDHYIIFTNSSAAKKYGQTMEDCYKKFLKEFPFPESENDRLMPVFLFNSKDQYSEFLQGTLGMTVNQAKQTAGVAFADVYACYYSSPKDTVHYHEGAHQLVKNRLHIAGGGSWFQEGLAVYFEMLVFPQNRQLEAARSLVKGKRHTPFSELFSLRSLVFSSDATRSAMIQEERYNQSGSIIYFLREGLLGGVDDDVNPTQARGKKRPGEAKFRELMDAVKPYGRRNTPWSKIIKEIYGLSLDEFEAKWVEYMENLKT